MSVEYLLNTICLDFHEANKSQLSANRNCKVPRTNSQKIKPPTLWISRHSKRKGERNFDDDRDSFTTQRLVAQRLRHSLPKYPHQNDFPQNPTPQCTKYTCRDGYIGNWVFSSMADIRIKLYRKSSSEYLFPLYWTYQTFSSLQKPRNCYNREGQHVK